MELRTLGSLFLTERDFRRTKPLLLLARSAQALTAYVERRARYADGLALLSSALEGQAAGVLPEGVAAVLRAHAAWLRHRTGDHRGALELAESLLSAGRDRGPEVALLAHKTVAASHFRMGAYAAAAAACEAAMSLARAGGHDLAEPEILEVLGMTRCEEGRFDDSRRLLSQALVHYRARGDLFGAASALYQLGNVYLNLRQPEDARPLLVEALQTARKAEAESLVPHIDYALGVASLELGDFAGARDRLSRALFAARRDGDASRQAAALSVLFRTAAKAGDRASAKRYLEEGLTIAVEIRETPRVLKLLIYLAEAWLAAGVRLRDAERLLRLALSQPEVAHWARELAEDLLSTAAVEAELAALREPARNGAHAGNGRSKPAPGAPAPPLGAPAITLEEAVALALEHAAADA